MLTEADLNRIKALLHLLNGNKPATREPQRRVQLAERQKAREQSNITFDIVVLGVNGAQVGHVFLDGDKYVFGAQS